MRKRQTPVLEAPALVQPAQLQLLAIPEVARILCIGRTKVYSLIKTDGLPTVRVPGKIGQMSLDIIFEV